MVCLCICFKIVLKKSIKIYLIHIIDILKIDYMNEHNINKNILYIFN